MDPKQAQSLKAVHRSPAWVPDSFLDQHRMGRQGFTLGPAALSYRLRRADVTCHVIRSAAKPPPSPPELPVSLCRSPASAPNPTKQPAHTLGWLCGR